MATSQLVSQMNEWAKQIASEKYHYVRWKESDGKTHTCPICKGRKYDDYYGWNCIGYAFAIWHHGGGIPCNCNCHVVANAIKILEASTDQAAYDLAVKWVGIKDIEVIRDNKKTIKSKLQGGDICWTLTNGEINHTYYYMGDGKYADSTSGRTDNIKAGQTASTSLLNKTVLAIRYTGNAKGGNMAKTITEVAREVIAGDWGSGDTRVAKLKNAGYNATTVQDEVNRLLSCRELIIQNMYQWAKKIADSHKYKYVAWTESYGHECAVCHPHNGENHGWQCIGFAMAVWHHAGLPIPCACGTIADEEWEAILNAKTDAEALKIAKKCLKLDDIKVIRNKNGIAKSTAQAGDMAALFVNGNEYQHTYVIMPNNKVADSTHAGGYSGDIGFRNFSGRYANNLKVLIRYTGNGFVTPAKKTVDQLANEVLEGKWGSGDSRKQALTECGYDYNAVQNKVNELVTGKPSSSSSTITPTTPTKTIDQLAQEVLDGKWGSGDTRKKKLEAAGYDYQAVQNKVNELLNPKKSVDELAQEVLAGKWGSGDARKKNLEAAGYDYQAVQNKVNELLTPKKTVDELAQEVLTGKWGSGSIREQKIKAAGYDYNAVQNRVNEILAAQEAAKIEQLAQEVLAGKWGSGKTREEKLKKAGYDYNKVQKRVNELVAAQQSSSSSSSSTPTTTGSYTGELPTYRVVKSNSQVIADAIKWAKWIASDNRFHYGYGEHAHHNGCYFCGTQKLKKNRTPAILDPEFTYCCNPFVGAAWAHGGLIPKALSMCQNTSSWDFNKGHGYDASSLFTKLGHPIKSNLKAGDVLCRDTHVALYIGNGKIAEAGSGDDNKRNSDKWNNSIRVKTLTDSNYANFPRVYRYNGSVNADILMRHGEAGDRVAKWQAFLDWYYDGQLGKPYDGLFGDNTLKWTKKFQEEVIGKGEGDGIVGPKTLAAAASVKKN